MEWPNIYRDAQLSACTNWELEDALTGAWKNGWHSFVIVMHSFEMISPSNRDIAVENKIRKKRFDKLCFFLAQNKDKFQTCTFSELKPETIPMLSPKIPGFNPFRTTCKYFEQFVQRLL